MINSALSSPGANSRFFASIHNGARIRHLARGEVPVQVRARRLREHEVVRGVAGAHPPFGPDHLRYVEPGCALVGTRPAFKKKQPSRKTQDTPPLVVPCLRCCSFLYHKSVDGRGCGQQPDAFFPLARAPAATRRILGWSPRSSVMLVVSHAIALCFPKSLVIACVFRWFCASGAARARSFCTHQCSRKDRQQLQLFPAAGAARPHGKLCVHSFKTHLPDLFFVCMCRRSETSTFGLCKAADVQRSGPRPGRRAHEAAQRQTQFLDHVLCLRNTITSRRNLPQCLLPARAA